MSATIPPEVSELPLADIEPVLCDLRMVTGLLGHVAGSDEEVQRDELRYIETRLIEAYRRLDTLWQQAWDRHGADRTAHETALAAAKTEARTANKTPGTTAQRRLIVGVLKLSRQGIVAAMEECDKALAALAEPAEAGS
jgi:hypothetical protein